MNRLALVLVVIIVGTVIGTAAVQSFSSMETTDVDSTIQQLKDGTYGE